MGVNIVHAHAGQILGTRSLELESYSVDLDLTEDDQKLLARCHSDESTVLDIEIHIEDFNVSIMALNAFETSQPEDPLPLIHPKLIDWDNEEHTKIDTSPNEHAIALYLNAIEPCKAENHDRTLSVPPTTPRREKGGH